MQSAETIQEVSTRFLAMSCIMGTIEWSCPRCGHVQRDKLSRMQYKIRCRRCHVTYEHGSVFRPPVRGRNRAKPRDIQLELAPLRRSLTLRRRLSDRECINVITR